jgi:hypothetical protein
MLECVVTTRREFLHTATAAALGMIASPGQVRAQPGSPGEIVHTVQRGDTLSEIAHVHGLSVRALKTRNNLRTDVIRVGQKLVIPISAKTSTSPLLSRVITATAALRIKPGRWRYVVAHHSAVEVGNARTYGAFHRDIVGMENGLAYHFVIGNGRDSGDGEIEIGPRWLKQLDGGHVKDQSYNECGIGICLVGNFQNHRPSPKQLAAFTTLVDWLRDEAPLGSRPKFTVHRWVDLRHTVCPGRWFPYAEMKKRYPA